MEDKKENTLEIFDESYWAEFLTGAQIDSFSGQNLVSLSPNSDKSNYEMPCNVGPDIPETSSLQQIPGGLEVYEDWIKSNYYFDISMQFTPMQHVEYQQTSFPDSTTSLSIDDRPNFNLEFDAFLNENWTFSPSNVSASQINQITQSQLNATNVWDDFNVVDNLVKDCNAIDANGLDIQSLNQSPQSQISDQKYSGAGCFPGEKLLRYCNCKITNYSGKVSIDVLSLFAQQSFEITHFSLWLLYPSVAQKSYRQERRFLCPQPSLYLIGDGWEDITCFTKIMKVGRDSIHEMDTYNKNQLGETKLSIKYPLTITSSVVPEILNLRNVGLSSFVRDSIALVTLAQFSKLYIADMDKQRSFALKFTIHSGSKTFDLVTKEIKVISKPPTLIPERDGYGLYSGNYISLFNRINCQSGSTRFLDVTNQILSCNELKWGLFRIWLLSDLEYMFHKLKISIDTFSPEVLVLALSTQHSILLSEYLKKKATSKSELIEYGDIVILEHVESGKLSIPFKVESTEDESQKGYKKYKKKERQFCTGKVMKNTPISQLQKIALSVARFPDHFLCQIDDEIMLYTSNSLYQGFGLIEPCIWTIVGTDVATVSFTIPNEILTNGFTGISHFPLFTSINVFKDEVVLHGDFVGDFWIFFGGIPAKDVKVKDKMISVKLLEGISVSNTSQLDMNSDSVVEEKVPVLMVYQSGIVFNSGYDVFLTLFY